MLFSVHYLELDCLCGCVCFSYRAIHLNLPCETLAGGEDPIWHSNFQIRHYTNCCIVYIDRYSMLVGIFLELVFVIAYPFTVCTICMQILRFATNHNNINWCIFLSLSLSLIFSSEIQNCENRPLRWYGTSLPLMTAILATTSPPPGRGSRLSTSLSSAS